jgi:hypothetical protein
VESACSQVVVANRCELSGARWSINEAEAMLKIRSVTASNLWDKYWDYTKAYKEKTINYSNHLNAVNNVLNEVQLCG